MDLFKRKADERIEQLEKELFQSKAEVSCLRLANADLIKDLNNLSGAIPEIKAQAIEEAVRATRNSWGTGLLTSTYIEDAFFQYAQKIREGK